MTNRFLFKIDNLIEGTIVKRPSTIIKSPYVADVVSDLLENKKILAHTAALGCCGLSDNGATILMSKIIKNNKGNKNNEKIKCTYRVYLSIFKERDVDIIVGIHPKLAEEITEKALKLNLLKSLQNIKSYKKETAIKVENKVDSRFDFTGIDENGIPFIMEVKNVPLADYEDITSKERKHKCYDNIDINNKVAYFPDG